MPPAQRSPGRAPELDFHDLLVKTSRTFALSIPALAEPLRREVTLAYLLFRIADTFEDAHAWPPEHRAAALAEFARRLEDGDLEASESAVRRWLAARPTDHPGYLELLSATPAVLAACQSLHPAHRSTIEAHCRRTCQGMIRFVAAADPGGRIALHDVAELRAYCYIVAGIVGELLTELFLVHEARLAECAPLLRERAASFGEALQLVNVLKDSAADAAEGRRFLPAGTDLGPIFAIARSDLERAAQYVRALQERLGHHGIVAFTALPLLLARETLARVEEAGPGAKVSRERVLELASGLEDRLRSGAPVVDGPDSGRAGGSAPDA